MIFCAIILRYLTGRKASRIMCILWGIVLLRMVCPFYFNSPVAIIDSSWREAISVSYGEKTQPGEYETIPYTENKNIEERNVDNPKNTNRTNYNPLHIFKTIWIVGITTGFIICIMKYIKLKHLLSMSNNKDGILYCDNINEAFVFGLFKPTICIPSSVDKNFIVSVKKHESTHLKRKDNIKKACWYVAACIYWFNPLVWIAFILYDRDLELVCDNETTKDMNDIERYNYVEALLYLTQYKQTVLTFKSFFGGGKIKERISLIVHSKKRVFIVLTILGTVLIGVVFFTMRINSEEMNEDEFVKISDTLEENYNETKESLTDEEISDRYFPENYTGYRYPVLPQMSDFPVGNHVKIVRVCQIPDDILSDMSTEELLQTVAAYPLWSEIYAFNTIEMGYSRIKGMCNGLNELSVRDDFPLVFDKMADDLKLNFPLAISVIGKVEFKRNMF